MSQITTATLTAVAKLARIKLTDEEIATYTSQLATILEHVNRINQIDTSSIAPTFAVTNNSSRFQSTSFPAQTLTANQVAANAPKSYQNYIVTQPSISK